MARIASKLCNNLRSGGVAHQHGITHRDLKPENVIYHGDGRLILTDFDLARINGEIRRTKTDSMVGTIVYASPEQLCGKDVTPTSDIYTLGVMLFELLTGRWPFTGSLKEIARSHLKQPPPLVSTLNPTLPAALAAVLLQALAKAPTDRFQRVSALATAVAVACAVPTRGDPVTTQQPFVTRNVALRHLLRVVEGPQLGHAGDRSYHPARDRPR